MPDPATVAAQLRALAAKVRHQANPSTIAETLAEGFELLASTDKTGDAAPAPAPAAKTAKARR